MFQKVRMRGPIILGVVVLLALAAGAPSPKLETLAPNLEEPGKVAPAIEPVPEAKHAQNLPVEPQAVEPAVAVAEPAADEPLTPVAAPAPEAIQPVPVAVPAEQIAQSEQKSVAPAEAPLVPADHIAQAEQPAVAAENSNSAPAPAPQVQSKPEPVKLPVPKEVGVPVPQEAKVAAPEPVSQTTPQQAASGPSVDPSVVSSKIDKLAALTSITTTHPGTETVTTDKPSIPAISKILLKYDESEISVCIPCIPRDISNLPDLIRTIDANTVQPKEIIIAISDTNDEQARNLEDILNTVAPHIRVTNTPESHYAGANRNRCASLATGRMVTFIDADDEMHFQRLQIVKEALEETGAKCVLHGFSMDQRDLRQEFHWHEAYQVKGSEIYSNMLNKEGTDTIQLKPQGLHIKSKYNSYGPHHGHPTCRKEVLQAIKFPDEPRGQDSLFLRQVLQHYGPIEESLLYVDLPLSIYHPSDHEDNAGIRKD